MGYKRQKYSASEELPISQRRQRRMMVALKAAHSAISPDGFTAEDFERQRRGQELLGRLVAPMLGMSWETFSIRHIPAAWVKPDRGHDHRRVILYCHGGGYTSGSLGYARILGAKLSHSTGYEVLSFAYRLAPEHTYPAALEDALLVWNYLMHQGYGARDVVVMGDSAGGNLALALTLKLREQKRRLPGTLVLFSPWTDMTCSGQSYKTQATLDPILSLDYVHATRQIYAGAHNFSDPLLSPLFADFSGFPPVFIQAGSNEILRDDSIRLRDGLVQAGVPCRLEIWEDLWHVFQMFPMKKAQQAMENMGSFLLDLF